MKKTFRLPSLTTDDPRLLESIKIELRKYVKRERRKTVPEGFDYWDFDCRVGPDAATAVVRPIKEATDAVDQIARAGGAEAYVEILAVPKRAATAALDADPLDLNPPVSPTQSPDLPTAAAEPPL